ncbi:44221_t:CDS:2, partial [Gigaspora margarita]
YKTSYCSFQSVAYGYKIENTQLAYNAKYFLAIHLLNGLGITKDPIKAHNLFKEVSTSNSKYKEAAKHEMNFMEQINVPEKIKSILYFNKSEDI